MNRYLFKRVETPNFSNYHTQKMFVENTHSSAELLKKELIVNQEEQILLEHRMRTMKEKINDTSSDDPSYSAFLIQIQMDQIELDEIKQRELKLKEIISNKQ